MIVPSIVKAGLGMIGVAVAVVAGATLRPAAEGGPSAATDTPTKVAASGAEGVKTAAAKAPARTAEPDARIDEARRKLDEALRANAQQRVAAADGVSSAPRSEPEPATRSLTVATAVAPRLDPVRDADELCDRARKELADGAVASARALLARAARSGSPRALHLLAEAYDPAALGEQGLPTTKSDAARARGLYEKAAAAGWSDASRRLAALRP